MVASHGINAVAQERKLVAPLGGVSGQNAVDLGMHHSAENPLSLV